MEACIRGHQSRECNSKIIKLDIFQQGDVQRKEQPDHEKVK